ncbi:MAG TPA: PAS domain S-box protein, partial [Candidatus Omnitrophota bacterium]|nr:PAS domain S-box protein [Candidatus Omnitrophota bacterium]
MSAPVEKQRGANQSIRRSVTFGPLALAAYPGPVVVLDADGAVLSANPRGESLAAAILDGRLAHLDTLLAAAQGEVQAVVETLSAANGGSGGLILELIGIPTQDGQIAVLGRDVTLERNLRSALVESRQRYKDLVEISSDFAWEVGEDGRFVFVSPKGALGYSADELVGRHPSEFVAQ